MPLTNQEREKKAVEKVASAQVNRKPVRLTVKRQDSVFNGTLVVVGWHSETENRDTENSVFFRDDEPEPIYFANPADLIRFLNDRQPSPTITTLLRELLTIGGAASLIALIVTITICYLALRGMNVPEILGNALATILGFYFGSKTTNPKG